MCTSLERYELLLLLPLLPTHTNTIPNTTPTLYYIHYYLTFPRTYIHLHLGRGGVGCIPLCFHQPPGDILLATTTLCWYVV